MLMGHAVAGTVKTGPLEKVWEFQASGIAGIQSFGSSPGVFGLRFSQDGQRVAVVIGRSWQEQAVLILDAQRPDSHPIKIDVNPQLVAPNSGRSVIRWSPSGQHLLLGDRIVDLSTGAICMLAGVGQFIGDSRVVVYGYPDHFSVADLNCHTVDSWQPRPGQLDQFEASAERGLLFFTQSTIANFSLEESSQFVMDIKTKAVFRRLPTWHRSTALLDHVAILTQVQFADSGKDLCGIHQDTVQCLSVDTGASLDVTKAPSFTDIDCIPSLPWVVVSDYGRKFDWIDFRWSKGSLQHRTIWDYRSGKKILTWSPDSKKIITSGYAAQKEPYRFDISTDGRYLVEGGAGIVTLYKSQP